MSDRIGKAVASYAKDLRIRFPAEAAPIDTVKWRSEGTAL